jgi:glycosyltransferase involved in cell wall biosynthesis
LPAIAARYPDIRLKILGEGNYRTVLENLTKKIGSERLVEFTGQVPYKRVLEELSNSDIALIPHSKSDHTDSTIPHKLFQYMYAGKPVIASNCAPIDRIIRASRSGYTYIWNSPEGFIEAFDLCIRTLPEYNKAGIKESIKRSYHWGIAANELKKIYV